MLPFCADQGIGVLPWSPLARGRLTRPWEQTSERARTDAYGQSLYAKTEDSDHRVAQAAAAIAEARGVPRAQVALAWLAAKSTVTAPIIGASKPQHLADAVAALSLELSAEEVAALELHYVPHAIAGFE